MRENAVQNYWGEIFEFKCKKEETERRGIEKVLFKSINSSHVTCIQWQEVNLAATIENLPKIRGRLKRVLAVTTRFNSFEKINNADWVT